LRIFGYPQYARRRRDRPIVVALGGFDGVHVAHRRLVDLARERADLLGADVVGLTFWPLPGVTLGLRHESSMLTTPARRALHLAEAGVDHLVTLHFGGTLAKMSPEQFVRDILVEGMAVTEICIGYNFTYGHRGGGNPRTLEGMGSRAGFSVHVLPPVHFDGAMVSSTNIRERIGKGDLPGAERMLGRPHVLDGVVIPGDGRGTEIGIPTANVRTHPHLLHPPSGVYAVDVAGEGLSGVLRGVASIGSSPTFGPGEGGARAVEVHVPSHSADLYGQQLAVGLRERIRDLTRFENPDQLVRAIEGDIERALARGNTTHPGNLRSRSRLC